MTGRRRPAGPLGAIVGVAALVALALGTVGCLDFSHSDSKTADDVVETAREVVRNPSADKAHVELDGTRLTVRAKPSCNLVEMETVEQTTTREREFEDDDVVPVALVEALSFVPMVAGVALLADSPAVYEDDPNQRLYNSTGQSATVAAGAVLLAVGVAMNLWPTVELIRSAVPDSDTSTSTRQGELLQRNVPCTVQLRGSGSPVSLRSPSGTFNVGSTDADDKLVVDLKQVLNVSIFQSGAPPVSMNVFVGEQLVATIGVTAVGLALIEEREQQDELAWRAADPAACHELVNEPACAGVRRYAGSFPQGRHISEANALLARIGQPVGQAVPSGTLVVAGGSDAPLVQRARAVAQSAAQQAMDATRAKLEEEAGRVQERYEAEAQKSQDRFEANQARIAEQSEKKVQRAGHDACVQSCRKECEANRSCRSQCEESCQ